MEYRFSPLTTAEYFAGIGLVRMGLQPSGWQVVFANDISEKKYEMYKTFFPDAEVRNDDLSGCLRTAVGGSGKQFLIRAGR